jgi:SAM-dependent methyltransferase
MHRAHWETEAERWTAWARAPGHDSYHDYGPPFLDEIVPSPGRLTLDLGCGEGRVTRDLQRRGHAVVGIDASPTMLAAASEAGPGPFVIADAAHLPFSDGTFELAVAYNVLMDLDELDAGVREVARVLAPGGRCALCVLHPVAEAGGFPTREPDAPFTIDGSYFEERSYTETFSHDGLSMTFSSNSYPLERYARSFEQAGFAIELLREPKAPEAAVLQDPGEARWTRVPIFLFLRLIKLHGRS